MVERQRFLVEDIDGCTGDRLTFKRRTRSASTTIGPRNVFTRARRRLMSG